MSDKFVMPPPVPAEYICTMPPSEWAQWWRRYPRGDGPLPPNKFVNPSSIRKKFDFSVPKMAE